MNINLLNKISNLAIHSFYDESKQMVIVHFFNENAKKNDIVAFLNRDMSWDIREIVDERSVLKSDREVVEIIHKNVGTEDHDSDFDKFVRKGVFEIAKQAYGEDADLASINIMYKILIDNNY